LQLLTLLGHVLKSGKVSLASSEEQLLQLSVKTHQINLNIVNNNFLKDVLKDSIGIRSFRELLRQLRNTAEELKSEGVTITISYKGVTVLTLGSNAKPNFSQLITGTTEIEINNLRKLIQMGIF
jgi:hypothetical protein